MKHYTIQFVNTTGDGTNDPHLAQMVDIGAISSPLEGD